VFYQPFPLQSFHSLAEYDAESFIYVLLWIACRYQDGIVVSDHFSEWAFSDPAGSAAFKMMHLLSMSTASVTRSYSGLVDLLCSLAYQTWDRITGKIRASANPLQQSHSEDAAQCADRVYQAFIGEIDQYWNTTGHPEYIRSLQSGKGAPKTDHVNHSRNQGGDGDETTSQMVMDTDVLSYPLMNSEQTWKGLRQAALHVLETDNTN
jgi:hypothetical protein